MPEPPGYRRSTLSTLAEGRTRRTELGSRRRRAAALSIKTFYLETKRIIKVHTRAGPEQSYLVNPRALV